MSKVEDYRSALRSLRSWDEYLLAGSGLPGPRGNLELAHAVADLGDIELFRRYIAWTAERAPANDPHEFLAFCGTEGLGRLIAQGDESLLHVLRAQAADPRWRVREAVAMALQRLGDADMERLLGEMRSWARGSYLEQRAAAAGLCEPRLLGEPRHAKAVLAILDSITASVAKAGERTGETFTALRKGLGYCWSVAVAALPEAGKPLMEKWIASADPDAQWIMKENLAKARLARMDARWVKRCQATLLKRRAARPRGSGPG